MTEVQPPSYMDDQCYTADKDRRLFDSFICTEGVANVAGNQLLVSGGGTSVSVNSGYAWIDSDAVGAGVYFVHNSTGAVNRNISNTGVAHTAAIVAIVFDTTYDTSGQHRWQLAVIQTYTPGGTLPAYEADADYATGGLGTTTNHNGMILLATIAVNASGTITSITDERPQAGFCSGFMSGAPAPDVVNYSSGTTAFTKASYPNLKAIRVRLWGGGGGGGGVQDTDAGEGSASGGGGGGAYCEAIIPVSSLSASENVVVGAGGTAGGPGNNGGSGGNTTFMGLTAGGGNGGTGDTQTTTNSNSSGGLGGTASGGDYNIAGSDGDNGMIRGGNVVNVGSGGAGAGGGGSTRPPNAGNVTGRNGTVYGSGGSGCWSQGDVPAGATSGGAGGAGRAHIELIY